MVWRRRGAGFSAREELVLGSDPDGARSALAEAAAGRGFEGWIRGVEETAREILREAGQDPDHPDLTTDDDDTPPDFAAKVLKLVAIVRHEIGAGRADAAAGYAAELG